MDREREERRRSPAQDRRKQRDSRQIDKDAGGDTGEGDKKERAPRKTKEEEVLALTTRTGGAYIPPARLRAMQASITDKSSEAYQRIAWEALKKSINGLINKVNVSNLQFVVQELFQENIVRGRGLVARSVIQAQTASPTFTHVYAALVAVVNTKFPQIGELILRRLVIQFRRGFKRNDKTLCLSSTQFIAHLVNQQVAHEVLALEILTLLLETPTDDSVEVAVGFLKESGQKLTEVTPRGVTAIFERLRNVLHEGKIDIRVQYMVEVMFAIRKDGFKDHQSVIQELDLIAEEDQFTHLLTLEDEGTTDDILNVFKVDPEYQANEEKYKELKREILDEGSSDEESGSGSGSESDSESEEGEGEEGEKQTIIDQTETNLIALRRTIYLTIQSALDFEECAHKLLRLELKPGQEIELCNMILDCCAQQRTYEKFFGLLAQRFCMIDKKYIEPFQNMFREQYETIHRLETNKLRNVAKFFSHLLHTDAISWEVLEVIKLNEDDTTSASRIFIKVLFQELSEYLGLPKLNDRLKDPTLQPYFEGLLPRDNPKNTRFSINFFTTIGLGGLTDDLREHLKNVKKQVAQQQAEESESSSSSSSDDSSSSSSSDSSSSSSDSSSDSSSEDEAPRRKKKQKSSNVDEGRDGKKLRKGYPNGDIREKEKRKGRKDSPESLRSKRRGREESPENAKPRRRDRDDSPENVRPPKRKGRENSPENVPPPKRRGRKNSEENVRQQRRGHEDSFENQKSKRRGRNGSPEEPQSKRRVPDKSPYNARSKGRADEESPGNYRSSRRDGRQESPEIERTQRDAYRSDRYNDRYSQEDGERRRDREDRNSRRKDREDSEDERDTEKYSDRRGERRKDMYEEENYNRSSKGRSRRGEDQRNGRYADNSDEDAYEKRQIKEEGNRRERDQRENGYLNRSIERERERSRNRQSSRDRSRNKQRTPDRSRDRNTSPAVRQSRERQRKEDSRDDRYQQDRESERNRRHEDEDRRNYSNSQDRSRRGYEEDDREEKMLRRGDREVSRNGRSREEDKGSEKKKRYEEDRRKMIPNDEEERKRNRREDEDEKSRRNKGSSRQSVDSSSEDSDSSSDSSSSSSSDSSSDSSSSSSSPPRKRKHSDSESENLKDSVKKRRGSLDHDNRLESKRDRPQREGSVRSRERDRRR